MSFDLSLLYAFDVRIQGHDALRKTELCKQLRDFPKTVYVNTQGLTISYIAHQLYGDQEYWPILCEINDVIDPFIVPDIIYVIPKVNLQELMSRYRGRG